MARQKTVATSADGDGTESRHVYLSSSDAGVVRRTEKVSEVVARKIVSDIASRDLPPGTMLPAESVMLERYKVGRASLREGLRILEIQGLITIKPGPGGGPVVATANSHDFGRMTTLHYQSIRATFRELIDARIVIEPVMAGLAARTQDPGVIAELQEVTRRTREGLADDFEYSTSASDFHGVIAGASGNRILDIFGRSLKDVYAERVSGVLFPMEAREGVKHAHEEILAAIEAGDGPEAERLMREHMEEFLGLATERYPGMLDEVVDWR